MLASIGPTPAGGKGGQKPMRTRYSTRAVSHQRRYARLLTCPKASWSPQSRGMATTTGKSIRDSWQCFIQTAHHNRLRNRPRADGVSSPAWRAEEVRKIGDAGVEPGTWAAVVAGVLYLLRSESIRVGVFTGFLAQLSLNDVLKKPTTLH